MADELVNGAAVEPELVSHAGGDVPQAPAMQAAWSAWEVERDRVERLRQQYAPDEPAWEPPRPNTPPTSRPSWLARAQMEEGNPAVLKACSIAKQAGFVSVMPKLRSGTDAEYRQKMDAAAKSVAPPQVDAFDVNDPADAITQIDRLVEEARSRFPFMSKEQIFARVYEDNPRLAAAERRQNRPSWPPASERSRVR